MASILQQDDAVDLNNPPDLTGVVAGSTIILVAALDESGGSPTLSAVSSDQDGAFTQSYQINGHGDGAAQTFVAYHLHNASAGTHSFSTTYSNLSRFSQAISVYEVSGLNTAAGAVDTSTGTGTSTTTHDAGSVTLTQAGVLFGLWSITGGSSGGRTPDNPPFGTADVDGSEVIASAAVASGTYAPDMVTGNAINGGGVLIAFQEAPPSGLTITAHTASLAPGASQSVTLTDAEATGKTATYGGQALTISSQNATNVTISSWPDLPDLGSASLQYNQNYSLVVTDGAPDTDETDTVLVTTTLPSGRTLVTLGDVSAVDESSIVHAVRALLSSGDTLMWETVSGTVEEVDTLGYPRNASSGAQVRAWLYSGGAWGSSGVFTLEGSSAAMVRDAARAAQRSASHSATR